MIKKKQAYYMFNCVNCNKDIVMETQLVRSNGIGGEYICPKCKTTGVINPTKLKEVIVTREGRVH